MDQAEYVIVTDKKGGRGMIEKSQLLDISPESKAQVLIKFGDDQQMLVPANMLVAQNDNSYYLPLDLADVEHRFNQEAVSEKIVIPVIEEELQVQKRTVETGKVHVTKVVHENEELVDLPLIQEEVEVNRVAVNRSVDHPLPVRYEGDTMIVPLHKEVLVVEKRLMLAEEVHITKKQTEIHLPKQAVLHSEDVFVERVGVHPEQKDDIPDAT